MSGSPVLRSYVLRLTSTHEGEANTLVSLTHELRREGEDWVAHVPGEIHNSPFLDFLFDAFRCQLAYLRMNAAERSVRLTRVHGLAKVESADFRLTGLQASFAIETPDQPSADELAHFAERCLACPVSRNLPHVESKSTVVIVGTAADLERP